MSMQRIDIYNHVMPSACLERVERHSTEPGMVKRMSSLRMPWGIEARVAMLGGSAAALRCGLDFFGADRVVFASD